MTLLLHIKVAAVSISLVLIAASRASEFDENCSS